MVRKRRAFDFRRLIEGITEIHACCVAQASRAVNVSLTLRNWAKGTHGVLHSNIALKP